MTPTEASSYQIIFARASSSKRLFRVEVCAGHGRAAQRSIFPIHSDGLHKFALCAARPMIRHLVFTKPLLVFSFLFLDFILSLHSSCKSNLASTLFFFSVRSLLNFFLGTSQTLTTPYRSAQTKTMEVGRREPTRLVEPTAMNTSQQACDDLRATLAAIIGAWYLLRGSVAATTTRSCCPFLVISCAHRGFCISASLLVHLETQCPCPLVSSREKKNVSRQMSQGTKKEIVSVSGPIDPPGCTGDSNEYPRQRNFI